VPKTKEDMLTNNVSQFLTTFLLKGVSFSIEPFSKKIDSELNINNMEKLLKIHFVLKSELIEFVENLPIRIRRIKTTVEKKHKNINNEIRGKINWQKTFKSRYRRNPKNTSQFVITRVERNYNTPENIILKELLSKINYIVFNLLDPAIKGEYPWVKEWFDKKSLREIVKRIYLKNIYMKRVELDNKLKITSRMIADTKKSRNPLYREAANLLQSYRQLMNYDIDPNEAQEILKDTFIKPEKTEVLFELYWVFKILKKYNEKEDVVFHLIEGGNNVVAEWEGQGYRYKLFHDCTGSFKFSVNWKNIPYGREDNYLTREAKVVKKWQSLGKKLLKQNFTDTLWGGRPDILIEKYDIEDDNLQQIFIGEVKYTNAKGYIAQGLKELLEYMALIKDDNYIEDINNLFEDKNHENVKGALFIDKTDGLKLKNQEDKNIKIFMYDQDHLDFNQLYSLIDG